MPHNMLTIGELAKRANVSTSLLRYYGKQQLLEPEGRTAAGYRLYTPEAERTVRFIRSAQRYGFSLNDIKLILGTAEQKGSTDAEVMDIAEQRFLEIERRLTEMLVLRHELELFLDDVTEQVNRSAGKSIGRHYSELVEQVCGHDASHKRKSSLQNLIKRLDCNLATSEWQKVTNDLKGRHMHIWRDNDKYSILFSTKDESVKKALERLAASEADCGAHMLPELSSSPEGYLFEAQGPNSFLFAQLFLTLERADA